MAVLSDDDAACERQIDGVATRLGNLAEYDPALAEVAALIGSVQAELSDAVSTLRRYADRADLDPTRLAQVERRMDAVMSHSRKYRVQPAELPGLLAGWRQRLAELDESADLAALETKVAARRRSRSIAARSKSRAAAAASICAVSLACTAELRPPRKSFASATSSA